MIEQKSIVQKADSIYLYPGGLEVSKQGNVIHTILGSCIAVCLYDKSRKTGGINHYMLPLWNGEGLATPKYGNIAITRLVEEMLNLGSRKEHLIAKVFGGGVVLDVHSHSFNIGEKNITMAFETLKECRIPITAQSVGGKFGRKIVFNTSTGEVVQRYVKPSEV